MHRLALAAALVLVSCQPQPGPEQESAEPPDRVENSALELAVADLPAGWQVRVNRGETLELERAEGLPAGRAWIELGPVEEQGINLIDVIGRQRELFEALPGGSFSGNGELILPDGRPAYYSRGSYRHEEERVEEFRISLLHPSQNRVLQLFYRYPADDDSRERLDDVLLLLEQIEATQADPAAAPGPEAGRALTEEVK